MRKIATEARALRGPAFLRPSSATLSVGLAATALIAIVFAVAGIWVAPVSADHTRFWRQSDYDEFQKGTAKGVALRSDGELMLAPKFASVADPNLAYLWALRSDSHGNLYAAGGSYAKVVRVDPAGKMTTVFDSTETAAQSIVLDKSDNLYVGTSPDGKIYKVTPGGQKTVFFDPKMKYIWDMVVGPDNTLYVATGDTGKIFAVTPDGKGDVFYSSDETHIRSLALDGKGNLIAGTEPNGWVMRIPLAGDPPGAGKPGDRSAFVLYETPKREITAIVPDASGNLYVAAIGEKQRSGPVFTQPAQQPQTQNFSITVTAGGQGGGAAAPVAQQTPQQQPALAFVPFPALASSSIYRIAADGSPLEIWSSSDDLVYALALSADGKVIAGIGNHGEVIELNGDRTYTLLTKTESDQVVGFSRATNGKMYVATANPGGIFSLGPDLESEGNFESQTFDAKIFSRWGRLTWWGDNAPAATSAVQFYVRTGNTTDPTKSWSPWSGPLANGAVANSPASRFMQWKAVLHGGSGPAPQVSWVDVAYLPKNVAPEITAIALQDPGVRVISFGGQQGAGTAAQVQLRNPSSAQQNASVGTQHSQTESARFDPPTQGVAQKGFQSVLWNAEDENDDDLTYSVYYRGENEKDWRLLKDKLDQRFYSWDTTSMPDGAYYLKIVASDVKSNPPEDALQGERESERFVVDNTPPQVSEMAADAAGDTTTVRFRVTDATSPVVRTQYSLDAGDWIPVRPAGDLSDSLDEHYVLSLKGVGSGQHTVSVRVYDQYENEAAGKVDFSVPATAAKR